jgi:hypothetical protein
LLSSLFTLISLRLSSCSTSSCNSEHSVNIQ